MTTITRFQINGIGLKSGFVFNRNSRRYKKSILELIRVLIFRLSIINLENRYQNQEFQNKVCLN